MDMPLEDVSADITPLLQSLNDALVGIIN